MLKLFIDQFAIKVIAIAGNKSVFFLKSNELTQSQWYNKNDNDLGLKMCLTSKKP